MFLQKWISALGAISFILSSLPFLLPKTENQKAEKKEKIENIKKKNRKNFLRFFPVYPLIFLPKKELKREEKKQKGRIKRENTSFFLSPAPFSKKERKEGKMEENMRAFKVM